MSIAPPFKGTTQTVGQGQVTVANANYDGATGTYVTIVTGGDLGTIIERLMYKAAANTTAGMIRFFLDDLTNARLFAELPVAALSGSATVQLAVGLWTPPSELIVPKGWLIKASTAIGEAINVFAFGGDV